MPDTHNPYAPPRAVVADIVPGESTVFQPVRIFSARGRMGRLRLLAYGAVAFFITYIATTILMFVFFALTRRIGPVVPTVIALPFIPCLALTVLWGIQRSHDMNWSGWALLAVLIGFAALILVRIFVNPFRGLENFISFIPLIWMVKKGTPGPNRYGPPPSPNTRGVKIMGGIGIFLFAIVAVGVIITLQARKGYEQRARAAQQTQQMQQKQKAPEGAQGQ